MPAPTNAGVFGIVRIIFACVPSPISKNDNVFPGAIEIYILLSIILSSLSFSLGIFDKPNKEAHTWYTFQEVAEKIDQLKPYDLVVLDVGPVLFQKYGHIFVVNKDKKFVEIKGADNIFADEPIYEFFKLNRKISIFRYKEIDDKLRDVLEDDVKKYYNKEYSILSTSVI